MSGNIIVTSAGLDLATSAHTSGPLIALKYCLPVYDYRIDGNLHNGEAWGTSAIDVSAAATQNDTTPTGEIIYNIDEENFVYALSDDDNWVLYTGVENITSATSTWEVSASVQSKEQKINLYDGTPLENYISGSSVDYTSATTTEGYWTIEDAGLVTGSNSVPAQTSASTQRYFEIVGYYPTNDSTARGNFKCRVSKDIGKVKFNKLAIYAVQVDTNGNETGDPVLFAQAMLTEPITKTNVAAQGFDDIVIDVQIQLSTIAASFSEVFYSTSGDYWSQTPGGLYYSEKVGIGTFLSGTDEPRTMLDVKSTSAVNNFSLRSWDDDNDYWLFNVESDGDLVISGTSGDVIIPNNVSATYLRSSSLRSDTVASFNGTTVVNGTFTVNADSTIIGDMTVTGDIDATSATFDNVQCTGKISATDDITTIGRVYVNDLSASDKVWTSTLVVSDFSYIDGNTVIGLADGSNLDVLCNSSITGDVDITGEITATSGTFTNLNWTNLNGTIQASDVDNNSSAPGTDVDDALNGLDNRVTSAENNIGYLQGAESFINGCGMSRSDANSILIAFGNCSVNGPGSNYYIAHNNGITKYINSNWSEGSGNGGFPSALTLAPGIWYHVFILYNSSNGDVDAGFDASMAATNLLSDASDFDSYRRIGSVLYYNDGASNVIRDFYQKGDEFFWKDLDFNDSYTHSSTGSTLYAFQDSDSGANIYLTPPNVKAMYLVKQNNGSEAIAYVYDAFFGSSLSTSVGIPIYDVDSENIERQVNVWVDSSYAVGLYSILANTTYNVRCRGWVDPRGQY